MRFLVPLAFVLSASASLVIPLSTSSGLQIIRRQTSTDCSDICNSVDDKYNACGADSKCGCKDSIAKELQECANCQLEADPTSADTLQNFLNEYTSGCEASGYSIGSLTLSATGAASSTSADASASITSTPAPTSTSNAPAFADSTSSVVPSISAAATQLTSLSSAASTATPSSGLTSSSNSVSTVRAQIPGAFIAAAIAAAYGIL